MALRVIVSALASYLCQKVQMQSSSVADDYALWHDSLEIYCMFTFAAFCSLSPDSPTQMLSTSFATRISRILFWDFFSLCTQQWRHQLCSAADTGTKQVHCPSGGLGNHR